MTVTADAAKRHTWEAAAGLVREDSEGYVDTVEATEGARKGQQVQIDPSSALQEDAQDARAVERTTQEESVVKSRMEREDAPRRENTLERAGEAQEVREPGWRHIGRIPGAPDPALMESDPFSRRPLLLPTELCERIIDWLLDSTWMLQRCALVCKAWTPRCRYWMQRIVVLWNRGDVQGHARRSRAQPHLLQQARSVRVVGPGKVDERASIPQLGTLAMMGGAKLPLVWRLEIQDAIWNPRDFHPLIFVHLSAFSSVTTLQLINVTFPKVREFGRLICALPNLVRLRCDNVLFTSTVPCESLSITRRPPSVRLTDLAISSFNETSSNVEANRSLIEHLCATGVVADLQRFEFDACASSDSKYLYAYKEPLNKLLKQCSRSLRNLKFTPDSREGEDVHTDAISYTIASVFDLTCCDSLETVTLHALNFEEVGYAWIRGTLESIVSKKLREVSIVMDRPEYSQNAEENLQTTVSSLRKDVCPRLNELFSNQDYDKLCHVDLVFLTHPDEVIPDAIRWASLLKAEMPKLHERGVLRTHVDVCLDIWNADDS